jgi:hypothetical protein
MDVDVGPNARRHGANLYHHSAPHDEHDDAESDDDDNDDHRIRYWLVQVRGVVL